MDDLGGITVKPPLFLEKNTHFSWKAEDDDFLRKVSSFPSFMEVFFIPICRVRMVIFMELRGSGVPINGRKYMGELGVITCMQSFFMENPPHSSQNMNHL